MFRSYILLIACALTSSVFAMTVSQIPADNHYFMSLSAGPTWISGNQSQTINLEPDVVKTFTSENQNTTLTTAELFFGRQKIMAIHSQPLLGQIGLSIVGAGNAKLGGQIWEDGDSNFNNFNYTYAVNHRHAALKGRLVGLIDSLFQPYISACAGVGVNHASDFTITPNVSNEVPAPAFQSNNTTTFTYAVGFGIQTTFTPTFAAAIGYEFSDWGRVQLSQAPGQTTSQRLTLNHLYGQELQFSLFFTV